MEKNKLEYKIDEVYLFDEDDKAYFDDMMKQIAIENNLLGSFNGDGEYLLSESIIKDLVSCEKTVIDKTNPNLWLIKSNISTNSINFQLVIENNSDTSTATIFLSESYDCLYSLQGKQTLETPLGQYKDSANIYFNSKLYKIFHLRDKDDKENDYDKEKNALLVQEKLRINKDLKALLKSEESINKDYLKRILKLLENFGAQGQYVLSKYKKELSGKGEKAVEDELYYFKLRILLEQIMFRSGVKFEPVQSTVLKQMRKTLQKDTVEILNTKKIEVKVENKPKKVIIPQAKKSSKGAEKSTKKQDKKEEKKPDTKKVSGNKSENISVKLPVIEPKLKSPSYIKKSSLLNKYDGLITKIMIEEKKVSAVKDLEERLF